MVSQRDEINKMHNECLNVQPKPMNRWDEKNKLEEMKEKARIRFHIKCDPMEILTLALVPLLAQAPEISERVHKNMFSS